MTISTQISKTSFTGNGVTREFPLPFPFMNAEDINTMLRRDETETLLALGTHYTLSGAGESTGGTLTMLVPPATGESLVIWRTPALVQETDYVENSAFPAETHERALDLLTMICQSLQEQVDRAVKVSIASSSTPDDLMSDIAASVAAAAGSASASAGSAGESAASATASATHASASAYSAAQAQAVADLALSAPRTYYVRTDGSDGNDGLANTSAGAFATIQHALDVVQRLNLNGYAVTIQVADGTYTAGASLGGRLIGATDATPLTILGNTATPGNCIVAVTGGNCFNAADGAKLSLRGFKTTTTTSGNCINATGGAEITFGEWEFGACAGFHRQATDGGRVYRTANAACVISGGAQAHLHVTTGGYQLIGDGTITLTGTPAFSAFFAGCAGAYLQSSASVVFSGSATGKRFSVHDSGAIKTGGSWPASSTHFPGDSDGTAYGSGSYDDYSTLLNLSSTSAPLQCENRLDSAASELAVFKNGRPAGVAGDTSYISVALRNLVGTLRNFGRISVQGSTMADTAEQGAMMFGVAIGGTMTNIFFVGQTSVGPAARPVSDGQTCLGAPSVRFGQIYSTNSAISTSDAREKTAIAALTDAEIAASRELAREIGTYKFLSAVAEKGDAARMHAGMTVQRAVEIMRAHGLDPMAYGFICFDAWEDQYDMVETAPAVTDPVSGAQITPAVFERTLTIPAGDRYSFRPEELLLFLARGFDARLAALEAA